MPISSMPEKVRDENISKIEDRSNSTKPKRIYAV